MSIEETLSLDKERLWLNDNGVCVARYCIYAYEMKSNYGAPINEFSLQEGVSFDAFVRDVSIHLDYEVKLKVVV